MFLNSWSLALSLCSLMALILVGIAGRTAIRVLAGWNPASDDNRQIRLENETWLSSTLVAYGLGFQIVSLVLFVLAADSFCEVIVGAMCATGALLANDFGMPTLFVKMAGVFLYGFWIVLHQMDISSEHYPLVRTKYVYLLLLLPFLLLDITLQTSYLAGLEPDIITSCCAVVFGEGEASGGPNLLASLEQPFLLGLFYGLAMLLAVGSYLQFRHYRLLPGAGLAALWAVFLGVGLVAITTVFSSYIYAMPFHRCPFCILKPEYHYFGFALYTTLLPAAFFGISPVLLEPFRRKAGLEPAVATFRREASRIALILVLLFAGLSSWHLLLYRLLGGEW